MEAISAAVSADASAEVTSLEALDAAPRGGGTARRREQRPLAGWSLGHAGRLSNERRRDRRSRAGAARRSRRARRPRPGALSGAPLLEEGELGCSGRARDSATRWLSRRWARSRKRPTWRASSSSPAPKTSDMWSVRLRRTVLPAMERERRVLGREQVRKRSPSFCLPSATSGDEKQRCSVQHDQIFDGRAAVVKGPVHLAVAREDQVERRRARARPRRTRRRGAARGARSTSRGPRGRSRSSRSTSRRRTRAARRARRAHHAEQRGLLVVAGDELARVAHGDAEADVVRRGELARRDRDDAPPS